MRPLLALLACLFAVPAFAEGTTTRHLWAPSRPVSAESHALSGGMGCYAWVADQGITNATGITWFLTSGLGGGKFCNITVYNGSGGLQVATTGAVDCSGTGKVVVTGLTPFSLAAGIKYQICTCGTAAGSYLSSQNGALGGLSDFRENGASIPLVTFSANDCTAAVAPATTGVLTGISLTPWYVFFTTSTP